MSMMDTITTSGLIATVPKHSVTGEGLALTSFRLASSPRRFNRNTKQWEYGPTNWFTVTAFRRLASNLVNSISKGDRVVVTGRMRVRDWAKDDRTGTDVDIVADTIGHDLNWGTAVFTRSVKSASTADVADSAASTSFDPDEAQTAEEQSTGGESGSWASPNGVPDDVFADSTEAPLRVTG